MPAAEPYCVRRTFDARRLTEIANNPEVRPWLGGDGPLDLEADVSNPANHAMVTDDGGFIAVRHEPGLYEVHSLFLKTGRSRTQDSMRDGLDYMFTRTDCVRLVTQAPDDNPAAAALAQSGGFKPMFRSEVAARGPTVFLALAIEDWSMSCAALEADGAWFHQTIETAKAVQNSSLPDHAHDPAHERAVGAAVRMIRAGNVEKAVIFYNRWARLARYPLISLLSLNPPVLDVGDAIASVEGDSMSVLLCR